MKRVFTNILELLYKQMNYNLNLEVINCAILKNEVVATKSMFDPMKRCSNRKQKDV